MLKFFIICLIAGNLVWGRPVLEDENLAVYGQNSKSCSCSYFSPDSITSNRNKRYIIGTGWKVNELKYIILNYTKDLSEETINEIIDRAFQLWARPANLTISKTTNVNDADFKISFEIGDHNFCKFRPKGLAHAFLPNSHLRGDIHINDKYKWMSSTCTGSQYWNSYHYVLFNTITHEIGHALGLYHSDVQDSLMQKQATTCESYYELTQDDINGIQKLYLNHYYPSKYSELCQNPYIDAIFLDENSRFVALRGRQVFELIYGGIVSGFPKYISDYFPGLANYIQAALRMYGITYFMKGTLYWKYEGKIKRDVDLTKPKFREPDAIFLHTKHDPIIIRGKEYFKREANFWGYRYFYRYDIQDSRISNNVSAAIAIQLNHSGVEPQYYLFVDKQYYRVDSNLRIIDTSYPRNTGEDWFGCR